MKNLFFLLISLLSVLYCSAQNDVTFCVDLNCYSGPGFTTPSVAGEFNNFDGTANPLSDPDGDGIWCTTIDLANGTYAYIFNLDDQVEVFNGTESCTASHEGFARRSITVTGNTTVTFVYNSCEVACHIVTFCADLNCHTGAAFSTASVVGDFNGFDPTANPLSDPDGDGVWCSTAAILGGTYNYIFELDGFAQPEMFTGAEPCIVTSGGGPSRTITVSGSTTVTNAFGSCDASCPPPTVPTLGEWGLITLALLLLTIGMLFLAVPKMATTQGQQVSVPMIMNNLPFYKKLYFQILPFVALVVLGFFTVIATWFGYEWTSADPIGLLVTVPLASYMLMLVVHAEKEND